MKVGVRRSGPSGDYFINYSQTRAFSNDTSTNGGDSLLMRGIRCPASTGEEAAAEYPRVFPRRCWSPMLHPHHNTNTTMYTAYLLEKYLHQLPAVCLCLSISTSVRLHKINPSVKEFVGRSFVLSFVRSFVHSEQETTTKQNTK